MHDVLVRLLSHLRGIWQYRWHGVMVAWAAAVAGWTAVYLTPDRYEASARVYVDTQSILKPLLSGLAVQPNLDQQIAIMSRTLISRPNVEKVVRMADLDLKADTREKRDAVIDEAMAKIQIKGTGKDNLYTISYQHENREIAKKVVQSLLTIFVEGSLGDKRRDSDSAKRFLDAQIKAYEQKLVSAENALKEFKRRHLGLMPGDGKDYFGRLTEASANLSRARLELREAENARDAIRRQLSGEEPGLLPGQDAAALASNPELDGRIQALRKNLDNLRLNYTEQHPDIVATKRVIEQLEEQRRQEARQRKPLSQGGGQNPVFQQLRVSLAAAEANVASLRARVAEYGARYNQIRSAADAIPQVEADLAQLNRDYEVNKANYEKLLARRESAQLSGEMEANTGVMDFRIIDPPRVPLAPAAPNRFALMSAVLAGALLAGIGVAFLMSQIRPTFNDRRTLREVTGLPLLGTVSLIWNEAQRKRYRRGLVAFGVSVASLLGSYGALMAVLFLTARAA